MKLRKSAKMHLVVTDDVVRKVHIDIVKKSCEKVVEKAVRKAMRKNTRKWLVIKEINRI